MKQILSALYIIVIATIISSLTTQAAFAGEGRCQLVDPTPVQKINGGMLGTLVLNSLRLIETGYKKEGKELKAVFIGRMGTDIGSSRVLSNYSPEGKFMPNLQSYRDWAYKTNYNDNSVSWAVEEGFSSDKRQIKYSHFGIAVKTPKNSNHPLGDNEWVVVHLLRQCRNKMSNLHDEGFWPFFLDDPSDYGSQLIVPKPEVQSRLVDLIFRERAAYFLMAPFYNVTAEWNDPGEQNSANWPLEMLALAQKPKGWFEGELDAGAFDSARFIKAYGELKSQQNELTRKFASKYDKNQSFSDSDTDDFLNPSNGGNEAEYNRLKSKIESIEAQLLTGYYPIFARARVAAQSVLRRNNYLPTRILLKGFATMANSFMGPDYVDMKGDNGKNNIARATTMLAFREYAQHNDLIDDSTLQNISDLRRDYAQQQFDDFDKPTPWEHFGIEGDRLGEAKNGIVDLCLLGRVLQNPKNKNKSPYQLNYCKRYHN